MFQKMLCDAIIIMQPKSWPIVLHEFFNLALKEDRQLADRWYTF